MSGAVHLEVRGAVAELRLDNPAKMNALDTGMIARLGELCAEVEARPEVRAVVLSSEGDRAFCTGADIKAWGGLSAGEFARGWVREGHRVFDRLARLGKPSVAALQGPAFGGGLELAACCDVRVVAPGAKVALPEPSVGIVPGWSGTQRLLRLLPEPVVKEMLLFGRRLDASRCVALGFAAEVAEDARGRALEMAEAAAALSPRAVEVAKWMLHAAVGEDRAAMVEALGAGMAGVTADREEGVAAFREKRKPVFSGT